MFAYMLSHTSAGYLLYVGKCKMTIKPFMLNIYVHRRTATAAGHGKNEFAQNHTENLYSLLSEYSWEPKSVHHRLQFNRGK